MYYLIERYYVGKNPCQFPDSDVIEIRTAPVMETIYSDWAVDLRGQYETLEEARAAIEPEFGCVRSCYPLGNRFENADEFVVETFKPGKYSPMSLDTVAHYCEDVIDEIAADTSYERMEELAANAECIANRVGYTLGNHLSELLWLRRQHLADTENTKRKKTGGQNVVHN